VLTWTVMPNHYQQSFFAALRSAGIDLRVCYYGQVPAERLGMGWQRNDELLSGETYVAPTLEALARVPDWRERLHVIPGCGTKFLRSLIRELSRARVAWVHWSEPSHGGLRWLLSYPRKRWFARQVNRSALGAFGIGLHALGDFRRW